VHVSGNTSTYIIHRPASSAPSLWGLPLATLIISVVSSYRFHVCFALKPVLDPLLSQAATSHEMIINVVQAFCPSIHTSPCEIDELGTKATPKTPSSVATNTAQRGLGFDGVVIQLMCLFQVSVESLPAVAHLITFISFARRIVASPHLQMKMLRVLVLLTFRLMVKGFRTAHECTAIRAQVPDFVLVGVCV